MAVVTLTPIETKLNAINEIEFVAATSTTDGLVYSIPASDEYVNVIIVNEEAENNKKITLKAPAEGTYAASDKDVVKELEAGGYAHIRVESAKYADVKGKVKLIPESLKVKVLVLY